MQEASEQLLQWKLDASLAFDMKDMDSFEKLTREIEDQTQKLVLLQEENSAYEALRDAMG